MIAAGLIAAAVVTLYGPSLELALTGDSYQWVQHAHAASHDPALLLSDLDTFLRPSNTWSLALDRALWGGFAARGFRCSSLVLHGLVALALGAAGWRLGLGRTAACTVALLWATSPFTDESVYVVAYRFQPLLLLAWLALIVLWPAPDETWSRWRLTAVVLAVFAAAASKETWVVTPGLVFALELDRRRSWWRQALRPAAGVAVAAVAYSVVYFFAFPSGKSYYELGVHALGGVVRVHRLCQGVERRFTPIAVVPTTQRKE